MPKSFIAILVLLEVLSGCSILPQSAQEIRAKGLQDRFCSTQPFETTLDALKTGMEKKYNAKHDDILPAGNAYTYVGINKHRWVTTERTSPDSATLTVRFRANGQGGLLFVVELRKTDTCPALMTADRVNDSWKKDAQEIAADIGATPIR